MPTIPFMVEAFNNVEIEQPCCSKCGYLLVGLPELRCPECGTPFDADYIENAVARSYLLAWERPELGGRIRRLSKTILHATLHPGRFFSAVAQRKDRPIASPGSFVAACVLASLCMHAIGAVLHYIVFFLQLARISSPEKALHSIVTTLRMPGWTGWYLPAMQVMPMLLAILVIAVFLARLLRRRSGAIRDVDYAAVFSPAIVSGAFIFASMAFVAVWTLFLELFAVAVYAQDVVLLLLVWHCCRKLLALSRIRTVATVVVCGLLQYGAGMVGSHILTQLWLLILVGSQT